MEKEGTMKMRQYEEDGFATEQEFLAGLQRHSLEEECSSASVPLRYKDGVVYTDDSDSHTLIFGSTGTKKTRNFCIPGVYAIGMAGESMVISDPKAEIYRNTSGFLAHQGYEIKVINLREPKRGAKWNPLTLPYRYYKAGDTDRAVEMISDFAMQLKAQVHTERDMFWENQAMDLLVGLILILFECEPDESRVHMESIQHIRMYIEVEGKDENSNVFWDLLKTFPENSLVRYKLASIYALRSTERTFASIISTFDAMIRVFLFNKKIMGMLDATEIRFDALFEKKTALYLIIPDEKTTFHFLVSVFVKQCYECLIAYAQEQESGSLPRRIHFILDEFSNFPKIADMPAMISAARSRNMRFVLVVQSKQQLLSMYGDDAETIKSNCRNWIYLSCRELGLLREIKELCGTVHVEGKGEVPLVSMTKLQALRTGWEDSQALILRTAVRPYITWVKDFSVYPQAVYSEIPLTRRNFECPNFFSVPGYLYENLKRKMESGDEEKIDPDTVFDEEKDDESDQEIPKFYPDILDYFPSNLDENTLPTLGFPSPGEKVYGIDLGTMYASMAYQEKDGALVVMPNREGETKTPSVVFMIEGQRPLVGLLAKESAVLETEYTLQFVRNDLGRIETGGNPAMLCYGENAEKKISPTIAVSYILEKMAEDAKCLLDEKVKNVVLTSPLYFGREERTELIRAGIRAGFNVVSVIGEPMAAALWYYNYKQDMEGETFLVYDLGGTNFDVTVMSMENGSFSVKYSEGDHDLGGRLWDQAIYDYIEEWYREETDDQEPFSIEVMQELFLRSEKIKMILSGREETVIPLITENARAKIKITRETFDDITVHLLEKTISLTKKAIAVAQEFAMKDKDDAKVEKSLREIEDDFDFYYDASKLNNILLVGGSTYMPQIQKKLEEVFKIKPLMIDPDEAVVKGAAIYGSNVCAYSESDDLLPGLEISEDESD